MSERCAYRRDDGCHVVRFGEMRREAGLARALAVRGAREAETATTGGRAGDFRGTIRA